MNQKTTPTCFQCGSPLVLMDTVTEHVAGSLFPQTTSTFRCSNQECQEEKDKQTAARIKLQKDKEQAIQKRADDKVNKQKIFDEHYGK